MSRLKVYVRNADGRVQPLYPFYQRAWKVAFYSLEIIYALLPAIGFCAPMIFGYFGGEVDKFTVRFHLAYGLLIFLGGALSSFSRTVLFVCVAAYNCWLLMASFGVSNGLNSLITGAAAFAALRLFSWMVAVEDRVLGQIDDERRVVQDL